MAMLNNQIVIIVYDNYDNYILYIITITIITSPSALAKLVNGVTILKIILIENDQTPWHRAQVTLATRRTRMRLAFQVRATSISDDQNPVQQEKPMGKWWIFPETIGKSVGKWDVTEESWGYNFFSAFADLWSLNWWRWASHSSKNYGLWYL